MNISSKDDGLGWLRNHDLPVESADFRASFPHRFTYGLPVDAGKKTVLARMLVDRVGNVKQSGDSVFWITEWGIWASCENMELFNAYRRSMNEMRSLIDAPFHLFDNRDLVQLECLLDIALYFFWNVVLITPDANVIVEISHDEWIAVNAKMEANLSEYKAFFKLLELKPMG